MLLSAALYTSYTTRVFVIFDRYKIKIDCNNLRIASIFFFLPIYTIDLNLILSLYSVMTTASSQLSRLTTTAT